MFLISDYSYEATALYALYMRITEYISSALNILFIYFLSDIRDDNKKFKKYLILQISFAIIVFIVCNIIIEVVKVLDTGLWYFAQLNLLQVLLVTTVLGVLKTNFSIWEYWNYRHSGKLIVVNSILTGLIVIIGNYAASELFGITGLVTFYFLLQLVLTLIYYLIYRVAHREIYGEKGAFL